MAAGGRQLSGLQAQVLALYRAVLREAGPGRGRADAALVKEVARQEMEKGRKLSRRNVQLIEHLIRKGHKHLDLLKAGATIGWQGVGG